MDYLSFVLEQPIVLSATLLLFLYLLGKKSPKPTRNGKPLRLVFTQFTYPMLTHHATL